jgi:hypothetical protein
MVIRHARRVGKRNQGGESYRKSGRFERLLREKKQDQTFWSLNRFLGSVRRFMAWLAGG